MQDPLIQSLLSAAEASQRAEAAEKLARLGPEAREAAVPLVRAAGDGDEAVRDWAVAALEELGPPGIADLQPLSSLCTNPELNRAYWACTLLGRLKAEGAAAVPALMESLAKHPQAAVQQRAAWALGQIGAAAQAALPALREAAELDDARLSRLARAAIEAIGG